MAETGAVVAATLDAAFGVEVREGRTRLAVDVTHRIGAATLWIRTADTGAVLRELATDLIPEQRLVLSVDTTERLEIELEVGHRSLLRWASPSPVAPDDAPPAPATEPAPPSELGSVEELYLAGRHLEQYRHATRSPEPYWSEALRRDPGHAATHTALGLRRYREARFAVAERHLRTAVDRVTALNPNPAEGAAHYLLGLTLVQLGREDEAYPLLAKATWLRQWVAPGSHQLALIDARAGRHELALARAGAALQADPEQLQIRDLRVLLLRRLGREREAQQALDATLRLDPLDAWARDLSGQVAAVGGLDEAQTLIDVALEYARCGEDAAAARLFNRAREHNADLPLGQTASALIADYHAAVVLDRLGKTSAAAAARDRARSGDRTWNFPSRLEDVQALRSALATQPTDATAAALLGHWHYAHAGPDEAINLWRQSAEHDPHDPVVWRNLAIATYNQLGDSDQAIADYQRALELCPLDARLWYESDQLLKRIGASPDVRLRRLERGQVPIGDRDDLCVEYAQLLVTADRADEALKVLQGRRFQPCEGGEGLVLNAWERTRLALCEGALAAADPVTALTHARAAIDVPSSLGEERHPLANPARLLLMLGIAAEATGDLAQARRSWQEAAEAQGDFTEMATHTYSENTYSSVLAARRLGEQELADTLVTGLTEHVEQVASSPATIDYFATSLPAALLFDDDPQHRRDQTVHLLRAQLALLAGDETAARTHLGQVQDTDLGHDLSRHLSGRSESLETIS